MLVLVRRIEGHRVLDSPKLDRDMRIVAFLLNFVNNFDFGQNSTVLTQSNF